MEENAQTAESSDLSSLEAAVNLVRGEFMEGFYGHDAAEFEQWVMIERVRLRRMEINLLERLSDHYLAQDQLDAAIKTTQRILDIEPWREEAHRQMMVMLARLGQRSAALTQLRLCRRALAEELDAHPDRRTIDLVERIRSGEFDAERRRDRSAVPPSLLTHVAVSATRFEPPGALQASPALMRMSTTCCLPPIVGPFIGRQMGLARLMALLDDPGARLVVITGPGGIGKTRLAVMCAAMRAARTGSGDDRFPDGVFLVNLAPLTETRDIVSATLETALPPADAEETQPVLPETSQESEDEIRPKLPAAEELFVHAARRVRPDFSLNGESGHVAHICNLVEHAPGY